MSQENCIWRISRREFLQGLAAAGLAAGLTPDSVLAALSDAGRMGGLPIDQALIKRLLKKAMGHGGEFAEVYVEDSLSTNVQLDEQKIRSATVGASRGVGIRVIKGIKVGYAFSDDFSPAALLRTAEAAALIANQTGSYKALKLTLQPAKPISPVQVALTDVPVNKKVEMLLAADEAARKTDPRVIQVMGRFADQFQYRLIANTDGRFVEDSDVMVRMAVFCIAAQGNDRRTGNFGGGGHVGLEHFATFTPELVARTAARSAVATLGAMEAPAGEKTVVLSNGWSGVLLHEAVGHGLEADFIRKKTSLYTDKVGQKVASELCTVIDDATVPNMRGTFNMDDEGETPQRKVLIENGILRGYMFDRLNAKLMGAPWRSTGNGRRESFRYYPIPRMSNTYLASGQSTKEDIIKSVKTGLYAKTFGGGQVDITNGNFVFEVTEAYLIENGEITKPVKGANLIGVGPVALQNVTMVGNDSQLDTGMGTCGKDGQGVPVGVGLPHLRIDKMTVGGTRT